MSILSEQRRSKPRQQDDSWPETRSWARRYVADPTADPKFRRIVADLLRKAESDPLS